MAIASPASAVDPALVEGAKAALEAEGFRVRVMPHACGRVGTYSALAEERLADLQGALDDPEVRAVLCARGGYGAVQLLDRLRLSEEPKWIIGFSDISALHGFWLANGVHSIHGSMAKELTLRRCPGDEANKRLLQILRTGDMPAICWDANALNHPGEATGQLMGGNLAVLDGLCGTPYDLLRPDVILVIEDIAEPIYKVERILWRLRLSGVLPRLKGLIVGQFTEYRPDANYETMERMIADMVAPYDYPVAFNAPIGHVDANLPWVEGVEVRLRVDASGVTLQAL